MIWREVDVEVEVDVDVMRRISFKFEERNLSTKARTNTSHKKKITNYNCQITTAKLQLPNYNCLITTA